MQKQNKVFVVLTVILMLTLFGCRDEPEAPPPEQPVSPETTTRPEQAPAPEPSGEAEQAAQPKQDYETTLESRLNELDQQITGLEDRIAALPAETKTEAEEMLRSVQARQEVAQERLEELKSAPTEGWQDLKASTEEAVNTLQEAYNNLEARLQ